MMYNYNSDEIIETAEKSNLTYKEVWETLSKIDVSPYLDTKGQFSYLSWSYARAILSHFYPQYRVIWLPSEKFEDSTMMLHCRVEIEHLSQHCWYPVYNKKGQWSAISNPTADDIQDNMQRAMVKCMAYFGLGMQVFHNGSGTPEELQLENPNETSKEQLAKALILIDKLEMKNEKPKSKK